MVFTGSQAMEDLACCESQGACERGLCMLAWRSVPFSATFGPPGRPDFRATRGYRGHRRSPSSPALVVVLENSNVAKLASTQYRSVHSLLQEDCPCLTWSHAAKGAPLQRVRHQPSARGGVLSQAPNARRSQGKRTGVRTGAARAPLGATVTPSGPARERRTVRDTWEREQHRQTALAVG